MPENFQNREVISQIQQLISDRLGLDIEMGRAIQINTILDKLGTDKSALLYQLRSESETTPLWQQLIYELTIGETYFFRNRAQFELLREYVLPNLLEKLAKTRHLYVWCAGCATGEEAYSMAILLQEVLQDVNGWQLTIVGTDVNIQAIEAAQRGIYRQWSFRHNDEQLRERYFRTTDSGYILHDDIRNMVRFRQANLTRMNSRSWAHIVMCRNVMLYFRDDARDRVQQTLIGSLHDGGWLMLGHAEALHDDSGQMQTHIYSGAIAYQKQSGNAPIQDESAADRENRDVQPNTTTSSLNLTTTLGVIDSGNTVASEKAYRNAVRAYHDEEHDRAERLLADLLTSHPDDTSARVMLAAVFANRGATTEAHAHLNTALRKDPLNANAHYLRAMLYLDVEEVSQAEQALRAALYSQPGHPLAAFTLGNLLIKTGDQRRARSLWQQAVTEARKLEPDESISDFNPRTAADFAILVEGQLRANSDSSQ